jgi:hypothetical protein
MHPFDNFKVTLLYPRGFTGEMMTKAEDRLDEIAFHKKVEEAVNKMLEEHESTSKLKARVVEMF